MKNPLLFDAVQIISESGVKDYNEIEVMLEDSGSPITNRYRQKLYKSIMDKSYIDFGDIPKSKGDITRYAGYDNMMEVLQALIKIGEDEKSEEMKKYTAVVLTAVSNIRGMKSLFMKAFSTKNEYVQLEYNTYVFTCIEATSSLLYEFIDYIKTPSSPTIKISLKDTKYRANLFYIQQLEKFNKVNKHGMYTKYISTAVNSGKENFIGLLGAAAPTIVGGAAIIGIILSIVPITRELVYQYKELKRKLSDSLELQAYFLEMNKACVENNNQLTVDKKKKILAKQEKLRQRLLNLSAKLRVSSLKASEYSKNEIEKDNKEMKKSKIEKEVEDDDDFTIL